MGVEGGLCPLRIVRPSGAIKIIYIKFILSQPLRRTVVGRGLVSLSPPFLYVVNDFIQKFSLYLISEVFWLPVGLTKLHSNLNYYISVRILLDIF